VIDAAIEAGARAWFDRIQAQRLDSGRKRPDGRLWQWEDLTDDDQRAYRALAEPIVIVALAVGRDEDRDECFCDSPAPGHTRLTCPSGQ
jgi:hypothetical protein